MKQSLLAACRFFDRLEHEWESLRGQKSTAGLLVLYFILALAAIELNRWGVFPLPFSRLIPKVHFVAVEQAFTLLLFFEVISLIVNLAHSVSIAVGKQFEILSLVLLRALFKEMSHQPEPLTWEGVSQSLLPMMASALGALLIFVVLGIYYSQLSHKPITRDLTERNSFVRTKKLVALMLLFSLGLLLAKAGWSKAQGKEGLPVFEAFYTLLVFSDILVMLISLRYSSSYHVVFRNSGYAVSTLLARLALIAPLLYAPAVGVLSALFALAITLAYNRFAPTLALYEQELAQGHPPHNID